MLRWQHISSIGDRLWSVVRAFGHESKAVLVDAFRLDRYAVVIAVLFLALAVPLVPRSTEDPRMLAAFVNDEPPLTMALEAMTVRPYLDPSNYYHNRDPLRPMIPEHWGTISYAGGYFYYGGAYFLPAFLVFAPLHWLGVPTFPLAPILLRAISVLAGLLSLVALYNLGKRYSGALGGTLAALFLLTDSGFVYYATIIHPDTLQLMLGILAVYAAARHATRGNIASLALLGVICGLIQGTKVGGPWTVPMAFLAVHWGLQANRESLPVLAKRWSALAVRLSVLAASAVTAYMLSTPYAFFGNYYFRTLGLIYTTIMTTHRFEPATIATWMRELGRELGMAYATVGGIALVWGAATVFRARSKPFVSLSAVLIGSQVLWYALQSRVWVSPAYLILSAGLTAFLVVALASYLLARAPTKLLYTLFATALLMLVGDRGYTALRIFLLEHSRTCHTTVEIDRWARAQGIASQTKIVHDDTAYFNGARFPLAHMHGGILTWTALKAYAPDYVVLSSWLYDSRHIRRLIETQALPRHDPDQYSVRLYQDIAAVTVPGPTAASSIELVHVIRPTANDPRSRCTALPGAIAELTRWKSPLWLKRYAPVTAARIEDLVHLGRNASGAERDLFGPELKIYRVRLPHITPITDGTRKGYDPMNPFLDTGGSWLSDKEGEGAVASYIGADFGSGGAVVLKRVTVRWILPSVTPSRVRLEYSSDGKTWSEAHSAAVTVPSDAPPMSQYTVFDVARFGPQRYWRLVAVEFPKSATSFGVRTMFFED